MLGWWHGSSLMIWKVMRTSWSCGHATPNQDSDLLLKSWKRSDRSDIMKTYPKAWLLLEWSRMMSWSQLIFDKSDSVHSRTKKYKNLSHILNWKVWKYYSSKVPKFRLYLCLNSSEKLTLMDLPLWTKLTHL
jgi:hypothetical protein